MLDHVHIHAWPQLAGQRFSARPSDNFLDREIRLIRLFAMKEGDGNPHFVGNLHTRFCSDSHCYIVTMCRCNVNKLTERNQHIICAEV
jgi:hypothetical protein